MATPDLVEPQTEAGRTLNNAMASDPCDCSAHDYGVRSILAIEAEAIELAVNRLDAAEFGPIVQRYGDERVRLAIANHSAALRAAVEDPAQFLAACGCGSINPKFGEGQPGGHFTDCLWAHEVDVRADIVALLDHPERLTPTAEPGLDAARLADATCATEHSHWHAGLLETPGHRLGHLDSAQRILAALREQPEEEQAGG